MLHPRDELIKTIFKGHGIGTPYYPWGFSFPTPPTTDQMGPWFKYNPTEAKALLTAAGVPDLDVEVLTLAGLYTSQDTVLQQEAAKIGIKLNFKTNNVSRTSDCCLLDRDPLDGRSSGGT
jgi:ABC-type transport system substrate-binding protein